MIDIKPLNNIKASIKIPGSKSITNRAFLISSLAKGKSKIIDPLDSDDTKYLLNALKISGIEINQKSNYVEISGNNGNFKKPISDIYIGNAGTTMRFLTSLLTFGTGMYKITCEDRMKERPIDDLVDALNDIGADIKYAEKKGYPPILINGKRIKGGVISISGRKSSQYVSSLLMIAPLLKKGMKIKIEDDLVSKPYIDTTINVMLNFGVDVKNENYEKFVVPGEQKYKSRKFKVQGDASSASYFMAAAAVCGGSITIENVGYDCNQGDINFAFLLEKMGAKVKVKKNSTLITSNGKLKGIHCDLNNTPDVAQTLAVCALFAEGETKIKNIGNLRIKETDRIAAIENEFNKLGADIQTGKDWIKIKPRVSYKPAIINTYNDHRMAMSFAVAGLKINGTRINDPDVVNKSFPDFWNKLDLLY